MTHKRLPWVLLTGVLGLCACNYRAVGSSSKGTDDGDVISDSGIDQRTIETLISPLEMTAGGTASVRCVVKREGQHLTDVAVSLDVSAPTATLAQTGDMFSAKLEEQGAYIFKCRTQDSAVRDEVGVTVQVKPGPAAMVDTVLPVDLAQAGAPVVVECPLYDAYGNELFEGEATGVDAVGFIDIQPSTEKHFFARGSVSGTFSLACRLNEFVDATPEELTIIPGIPGDTQTAVTQDNVGPEETVGVSCNVTDAFGNELSGITSSFSVLAADGSFASTNGLALADGVFSATRAGTYYVFCSVPGYQAGDESPAVVVVHPGLPASWVVDLLDQDCYWQDRGLPIAYAVYDHWGNLVPEADVQVRATGPGYSGTLLSPNEYGLYVVNGQGDFDIELTLAGETYEGVAVPPQLMSVRIDSTPPTVSFNSLGYGGNYVMTRPALMQFGTVGTDYVTVNASVSDQVSYVTSVSVNGQNATVPASSSSFNVAQPSVASPWGMSVLTANAVDECGNRSVTAQAYHRSPTYYESGCSWSWWGTWCSPNTNARVGNGALAHLNQPIIDDYYRPDLDDVASVAQYMVRQQNFSQLLPTYWAASPDANGNNRLDRQTWECAWGAWYETNYRTGYEVGRRLYSNGTPYPITYSPPTIEYIRAKSGGAHMRVRLNNLNLPMRALASLDLACLGEVNLTPAGDIGASWIIIDGDVGINQPYGGAPNVTMCSNCLSMSTPQVNISWGEIWLLEDAMDWITQGIVDVVWYFFEDQLVGLIEGLIKGEIEDVLEEFLAGFKLETSFNVPAPLTTTLNLSSGIDLIAFGGSEGSGYGQLGLFGQIYPSWAGVSSPRGAIKKDGARPQFSTSAYTFGIGLKDDLVNQILWAIWYSGALSALDLADLLALGADGTQLDGVNLTMNFTMPPVMMDPAPYSTTDNTIRIGIGDVYVDATVDLMQLLGVESGAPPLHVGMYMSAIVDGSIDIENNAWWPYSAKNLLINLDPNPTIWVQVVEIDDQGYQGPMSDLLAGVLDYVLPTILQKVIGAFPIPEFDLNSMAGINATWVLRSGDVDRGGYDVNWWYNDDYHKLTGSIGTP